MQDNMKIVELKKIIISSGQIMSRVTARGSVEDNKTIKYKVIIPKAISEDGQILNNELPTEELKAIPDDNRITVKGDIVMKLSAPYNAAIIDEKSAGCVVPSFCAIIRNHDKIDTNYLLAFLNSKLCQEQLKLMVAGATITILSVGKIKDLEIPLPDIEEQKKIGNNYIQMQKRLNIMKQIIELETKRNDIQFVSMVRK